MNIFETFINEIRPLIIKNKKELNLEQLNEFKGVTAENPPVEFDFDLSLNISLVFGKINKQDPKILAEKIKKLFLKEIKNIDQIEVAGPGFLNISFSKEKIKFIISSIFKDPSFYGATKINKSYNIEFVSANPTGPLHVGHCRGAIYGDVLSNLLKFNGNTVTKEYYINDYGNQIINFTKSVFLRIQEIKFGKKFINSENIYPGEYIIDIAKNIIKRNPNQKFNNYDENFDLIKRESLSMSMNMIKSDLKNLGINHDNFFSEAEIVKNNLVKVAVDKLKKGKFVEEGFLEPPKGEESKGWKKTKRLIFKSTLFGDDTNRALQKNDGSWTYFANDLAYHSDKVSRKYDFLVNILGADHTGYIKRITAAVNALSNSEIKLVCKVCQLVKLFKNGEPYKMSKRAGDFISLKDLLNEVNKDSIRFMMLNRGNDVELDFDFDKVLEKSKDNPVFYVQYCYARINSIFKIIEKDLNAPIDFNSNFAFNKYEKQILRKIFDWPKVVLTSSNKFEPHRIPFYLYELATLFHSYWSKGNENDEFKFIKDKKIKNNDTLIIIKLVSIVIENGMKILGVSLPRSM
ncbi:MAG: arginine--tRNA ligase [Pelagibacteraceae bacterium]